MRVSITSKWRGISFNSKLRILYLTTAENNCYSEAGFFPGKCSLCLKILYVARKATYVAQKHQ